MKFGKLNSIEEVDFRLPPDPKGTTLALEKYGQKNQKLHFYIGCTGWSMKEWVGKVYPKGTKSKDYLKHYALQFNTIELNTTHYRTPNFETIAKWKAESADDFKFCPKILQAISHSRDLGISGGQIEPFCNAVAGLEEKLGCCFIQLPPYFGINRLEVLERFLAQFPKEIPLAVELRHESWFNKAEHSELLFETLEKYGVSTVITDVAGRRDVLHQRLTTATAMIRFVGNALHPTDYQRIDDWVARILGWHQQGLSEVYFFPHEPDNLLAPDLAKYLFDLLKNNPHISVRGPVFDQPFPNEQMSLF